MTSKLATFVDRQGKPPATPEWRRLEARDAVALAKFFVALGFAAEKQTSEGGRPFISARANGVVLEIHPAREPRPDVDWNMTLFVADAAAASARAVAVGATIDSPLKEIPGGKKCVVVSPEGQRVVVAERRDVAAVAAVAATRAPLPPQPAQPVPPPKIAQEEALVVFVAAETTVTEREPVFDAIDDARDKTVNAAVAKRVSRAVSHRNVGDEKEVEFEEDEEDEGNDGSVGAYSPTEVRTLRRVRIAATLTALGCSAFIIAAIIVWMTRPDANTARRPGSSSSNATPMVMVFGILLGGWIALIGGKCCVITRGFRRAESDLINIAFLAEIGRFICAALSGIDSLRAWTMFGFGICSLTSSFAFTRYLGQVAESVEDRFLVQVARLLLGAYAVILLGAIVAGIGASLDLKGEIGLAVVATGFFSAVAAGFLCQIFYIAFNFAIAVRLDPRRLEEQSGGR